MNDMTEKDLKDHPLRPKRQDGGALPVRINWLGRAPEEQNQRARIGIGDKGIKDLIARDAEYTAYKRKLQAEALRK